MSSSLTNIFLDYQIIQITFSSLSLIACILVIIMYIRIKTLHVEAFKIIIMLISLDTVWSLLIIVSDSLYFAKDPPIQICYIIYVLQIQSGLLSLFCTSKIAIDLYLSTFSKPEYFNKYVIGSLTLFSLIMGIMPVVFKKDAFHVYDGSYCYIKPLWVLCIFFIPMAICLLVNTIFMILTFANLKKITENKAANRYLARLFIYPIITIIVFAPVFNPFYHSPQFKKFIPSIPITLAIICSILQSSIGLIDSMAYCITAIKNQLSFLTSQENTLEINLTKTDLQNMKN